MSSSVSLFTSLNRSGPNGLLETGNAFKLNVCLTNNDDRHDHIFGIDTPMRSGTGSVLTAQGQVEMDAAIMDGRSLSAGGVACLQNIAHPISVARLVMEKV